MSSSRRSNERQRERNMARHQETGWRECKGCGKTFLPPFGKGSGATRYCEDPHCQAIKYEAVRESKAKAMERYKERGGPAKQRDVGKQWKCRGCGRMTDNRLDCWDCRAKIVAANGNCSEDFAQVETLDISNMGLIPC